MEERKSVQIPTWFMQIITTLLLGLILTGVVALNVRFGRIEQENAIQNVRMDSFEKIYATESWTLEKLEKFEKKTDLK